MVTQKSITPPALKGPTLPLPLWGYPKGVRAFSVLRTLKGSFFRGDPIFCDHISPSPQGGEDNPFISPPPNKKGANAHRAGAHSALNRGHTCLHPSGVRGGWYGVPTKCSLLIKAP